MIIVRAQTWQAHQRVPSRFAVNSIRSSPAGSSPLRAAPGASWNSSSIRLSKASRTRSKSICWASKSSTVPNRSTPNSTPSSASKRKNYANACRNITKPKAARTASSLKFPAAATFPRSRHGTRSHLKLSPHARAGNSPTVSVANLDACARPGPLPCYFILLNPDVADAAQVSFTLGTDPGSSTIHFYFPLGSLAAVGSNDTIDANHAHLDVAFGLARRRRSRTQPNTLNVDCCKSSTV